MCKIWKIALPPLSVASRGMEGGGCAGGSVYRSLLASAEAGF